MPAIIALILSIVAVVLSTLALRSVRTIASEQRALRLATGELQGRLLNQAEQAKAGKARVEVTLENDSEQGHRIRLRNASKVAAHNVFFQILDCPSSILVHDDFKTKIPIQILQSGSEVTIQAAIGPTSPRAFKARVRYKNPDDTLGEEVYNLIAAEDEAPQPS